VSLQALRLVQVPPLARLPWLNMVGDHALRYYTQPGRGLTVGHNGQV
jgi:hypothetical protein